MLRSIVASATGPTTYRLGFISCKLLRSVIVTQPISHFPRNLLSQTSYGNGVPLLLQFIAYYGLLRLPVSQFSTLASLRLSSCLNVDHKLLLPVVSPVEVGMERSYCCESVVSSATPDSSCSTNDADSLFKTVVGSSSPECDMEKNLNLLGISLTTPLVVEVLQRLHYEEKLAFRFFTWAGHQEHYDHETQAYNEMIDILSSTKYKVKQFRIGCDMLDYMKRNDKRSVPLDVLLKILRQYTEKHLTHLHKFAKKKKIRVKTQPEINALNLLLDSLCKCSLVEDAESMLRRIQSKVKPNASTYNILFFGWCRVRNPTRGMNILDDMIKMGHTPDNFTYNTAIDTFCKAGMVTEAAALLEFMRTRGSTMSSPIARTYAIMIVAFVQSDRMVEAFKLLGDMISSGSLPDVSTYKEMIEGMCLAGKTRQLICSSKRWETRVILLI